MSLQSDYARGNAQMVAAAASLGLISTQAEQGYGKRWRVTLEGLQVIRRGSL